MNTPDDQKYEWAPDEFTAPILAEREPFLDFVAHTATDTFGIKYLFPWQRLVIANILDAVEAEKALKFSQYDELSENMFDEDGVLRGRQIVLLPTGAGKSLCFQIPALLLDGPTLIVYPLLALMGDQLRSMKERGLDPVYFRGGQSTEEREAQYRRLEGTDGRPRAKLIIANPEVLANTEILERIAAQKPSHLAIDEAHCVSEWGDSFRPAYLELDKIIKKLDPPAVTAFTATASPIVLARIAEVLFDGSAHIVRGDSDRPNIIYSVNHCRSKDAALIREVATRKRPLVIFCATRGGTERSANLLRNTFNDTDIRFYHAGLQKNEKLEVEAWFHSHTRAILTTTCAWGMGIDKKDVRTVIHRDPPPTVEAYTQEAGRGGRDGTIAEAVLLWSPADRKRIERLNETQHTRAMRIADFAESGRCRREVLLEALGETRATADSAGGEQIACSGCDICDGKARQSALDSEIVLDFINKNRRCYSREEIIENLYEAGNRICREKYGVSVWKKADFMGILAEFEKEGLIKEKEKWPWKNKMTITEQQRSVCINGDSRLLSFPFCLYLYRRIGFFISFVRRSVMKSTL